VVTGGSTGIGAEICRQMLEGGYEVISLARRKPAQSHARLHALEVDLMDRSATERAAADIADRFPISHIVHNAGIIRPALLPDVGQEDLQALMQLHLGAALTLVQAALPAMKRNNFGRIVLMSSRGALGLQTRSAYSATKAGMIGMARAGCDVLLRSGQRLRDWPDALCLRRCERGHHRHLGFTSQEDGMNRVFLGLTIVIAAPCGR
jgi:NAD(P)-dependent dehydrogenase (short-subunit alcohol dehydrogenase family)